MSGAAHLGVQRAGSMVERAPAKVNLLLHVGARREDGLHKVCSVLASIDLADEVAVSVSEGEGDTVVCPGVDGPNVCAAALDAFREAADELPPLDVRIQKRIPVAGGLGGGSADAGAVLRAANELAGHPLDREALRGVAARVGADVPSQVEPRHALIEGAGEAVEPIVLPAIWLVLVPQREGLSTADVYAEADRIGAVRERLDPDAVRALGGLPLRALARGLENDLQAAALSLRPEIGGAIRALERAGAMAALVTGSGPTAFGVFADPDSARVAAASLPGAIFAGLGRGAAG